LKKKRLRRSGYLSSEELKNPGFFREALPKIRAMSGLSPGQEREAWNWRAHALRRGKNPLAFFVYMMKNPGKAREVTAVDEDQAGRDLHVPIAASPLSPQRRYQQFRKTWLWQQLRKQALRAAKYTCHDCGKRAVRTELQVHHRNYDRPWGRERHGTLAVLCYGCHRKAHGHAPDDNLEEAIDQLFRNLDKD